MEEDFVPHEQALVLIKELDFKCTYHFKEYDTEGCLHPNGLLTSHNLDFITAPLYQQVFKWFRKNHKLNSWIPPVLSSPSKNKTDFGFVIHKEGDSFDNIIYDEDDIDSKTFEQAQLACLKQLIEIVKTKQK